MEDLVQEPCQCLCYNPFAPISPTQSVADLVYTGPLKAQDVAGYLLIKYDLVASVHSRNTNLNNAACTSAENVTVAIHQAIGSDKAFTVTK
jgi:hypothetical protein